MSESDISILIPVYNGERFIATALQSAIETAAGEIIVVDNMSSDDTVSIARSFKDTRIRVIINDRNIGIWCNHLQAISYATRPWIKFLHADDMILPGGLARMAKYMTSDVVLIWSNPIIEEHTTGRNWVKYSLKHPMKFNPDAMMDFLSGNAWILGTPSLMLIRKSIMNLDPEAWRNDLSADLVMGVCAAAVGSTVLLPDGNLKVIVHDGQDGMTQGHKLSIVRALNTGKYLMNNRQNGVSDYYVSFSVAESLGQIRNIVGLLRRGVVPDCRDVRNVLSMLTKIPFVSVPSRARFILAMLRAKYRKGTTVIS